MRHGIIQRPELEIILNEKDRQKILDALNHVYENCAIPPKNADVIRQWIDILSSWKLE